MSALRIVQVSDTHISRERAYFIDNWDRFVEAMQADPPDLIVHSGDVSFDGAGLADDIAFSAKEMDRLPKPWAILPGNHDIGESPLSVRLGQPVDEARIGRWRSAFGAQFWQRDLGAWRLVAIDTALLGSGRPEERAQEAALAEALESRAGRPVLLFMHMPPYLDDPAAPAPTSLAVPHAVRSPLLAACRAGGVRAIACGHVHVYRHLVWEGIDIVWAPATSFFNRHEREKAGFGTPKAGYLEWRLEGERLSHRVVEPPLMFTTDVGVWNAAHGSTTHLPPRPLGRRIAGLVAGRS